MVIVDTPPLLFVHIPKTGGLSVVDLLAPEGRRDHPLCLRRGKHETLAEFRERHGTAVVSRFHVFSIVRDPLDRFVSHYRWLKDQADKLPEMREIDSLDDFARSFDNADIRRDRPKRFLTQADFVVIDGRLGADTLLKQETLPDSLLGFLSEMGIEKRRMPRNNASIHPVSVVSAWVRGFVADYYREDYERFGYTPPFNKL